MKNETLEAPDIRGHVLTKFKKKPAKSKIVKGLKTKHKLVAVAETIPSAFQSLGYKYEIDNNPPYFRDDGERTIIEFCCEDNSALGQNHKWNYGCKVVRLTEAVDMTTLHGV